MLGPSDEISAVGFSVIKQPSRCMDAEPLYFSGNLLFLVKTSESNCRENELKRSSVITDPWWEGMAGSSIRLLLLTLTVCAVWLTIEDRWGSNFQFPVRYTGDSHSILGLMKLSREGDLGLFTHIYTNSLGAPFTAQLNDFPQTERVIVWLAGQMSRVIGLMPAANAILMLSCATAASSFYLAARLWRVSRLTAWSLGIVYAFLPQSQRSLDHLGIAFSGLLPLQLYCCWYIATVQKLSWRSFRLKLTFTVCLLTALLNIYWIFFFLHIYSLALLYRLVRYRKGIIASLSPLAATCLVAGAFLTNFIAYRASYGENPAAVVRSYFDVERWALKPIDLLLPNWGLYLNISSKLFSRYYNGGKLEVGEDWWGAYIGLTALSGLLLLVLKGAHRQLNKRVPSLPYLLFWWLISYTSVGGTHAIISLILNSYNIRSINRYSAAIATIGLLYFAFSINKWMKNTHLLTRLCSLTPLALLALLDQSFKIHTFPFDYDSSIERRVTEDKTLVSILENRLEAGAMIYTLPAMDFPEPFAGRGASKFGSSFYNSMRPFLYSSKLRYSYGSHKGRQGADWQLDVQELPAGEMATALESYGFSGILLNRKGYEDRGEKVLAVLAEAGWPMEFEQGIGNEWVFIRLTPKPNPILPTLTPYGLSVIQ